jgi:hypothetical protein
LPRKSSVLPQALADAVEKLLLNSNQARARSGRPNFSIQRITHEVTEIHQQLRRNIPCCPSTINHQQRGKAATRIKR